MNIRRTLFRGRYRVAGHVLSIAVAQALLLATASKAADLPDDLASLSIEELGNIKVTAQKREENLQQVPISIIAFSGAILEKASVRDIKDLPRLVPNFSVEQAAQSPGLRIAIRGIGTFGNSAIEPSVAPFLDGIYVPRSGMIFASFLDLEAIEVLRGPQGTMFGRNASMGALVLRTVQPTDTLSGTVKVEAGSGNRYRLEASSNVPLSDRVSTRIAVLAQAFGGYWHNTLGGGDLKKLDQVAGRASVKVKVNDALTWTARGEYAAFDGSQYPNFKLDYRSVPQAGLARLTNAFGANIPNTNLFGQDNNVYFPPDALNHDHQWSATSELSWASASGFNIKLLDSYRDWRNHSIDPGTSFLPVPIVARDAYFNSANHSHELQFLTPKGGLFHDRFDAVSGVYYFHETYGVGEANTALEQYCPLIVATLSPALMPSCLAGPGLLTDSRFRQVTKSVALYTEGHTKILPGVEVTTGVRWTDEQKTGSFIQTVPNAAGAILRGAENTPLRFARNRVTWKAGLSWRPYDDIMLFSTVSTGYKSGGFNSAASATALGLRRIYGPESTTSYEVGAKTAWMGNRLIVNATLYRMDIDGYQDRSFDGIGYVVRNVGSLRHQGVELETQARVDTHVRVNISLAYLDSRFTSYPNASALPGLPGTQDLTNGYAHFAPKWSGTVGLEWADETWSIPWTVQTDVAFRSTSNIGTSVDNNPQTLQKGYALLNARFTLGSPDQLWRFSLFGENLANKGYSTVAFYQTFDTAFGLRTLGTTGVRQTIGNPRTFGASMTRQF
ncbi:MAG: TonB-dependent receptor [Rhodospirillaceae bacterium]|nr:MAG: TonB-dependent receptor [Rhodospirillaceae bacterium]